MFDWSSYIETQEQSLRPYHPPLAGECCAADEMDDMGLIGLDDDGDWSTEWLIDVRYDGRLEGLVVLISDGLMVWLGYIQNLIPDAITFGSTHVLINVSY